MCLDEYPDFMSIEKVGRGTPKIEHFRDAAELAAAYIANEIDDNGSTATWWEVKNESTIKAEWDYHYRDGVDAWKLMADLHNDVADAVHTTAKDVRVGGPSSAWMQLQVADFGLYRNQARFMDLTREKLDFYSHHFYEDIGSLGAWERRDVKYTNYLLGRLEAILDMLFAHMHETQNVKPMLITECGSLQAGQGTSDYWLRIRSFSAYMHKFMQRPDQIELAVPFVFLTVPWSPTSGNAAFIPEEGKPGHSPLADCRSTPVAHFFELWRDFDGRRIPVSFDRDFLDVTAVHQGNKIQIAVTNMGGRRIKLSPDLANIAENRIVSLQQKRLFHRDGEIVYQELDQIEIGAGFSIDVEETSIITIELKDPLQIEKTTDFRRRYAKGTAVKLSKSERAKFQIDSVDTGALESAELIVGLSRNSGIDSAVKVTFNGQVFSANKPWLSEFKNLFNGVSFAIPVDLIREENDIHVHAPEGTTITSVHLETRSLLER